MKTYSIVCRRSWCEGQNEDVLERYSSIDEARKSLKHLFHKLSTSKRSYSNLQWVGEDWFRAKNEIFKYDNTESYEIEDEEIDVKDKFDPSDWDYVD